MVEPMLLPEVDDGVWGVTDWPEAHACSETANSPRRSVSVKRFIVFSITGTYAELLRRYGLYAQIAVKLERLRGQKGLRYLSAPSASSTSSRIERYDAYRLCAMR